MRTIGVSVFAAALLAGVAPALAISASIGGVGLSVGGGSGSGTSASASAGGTTATATVGGGNVATVGIDGVGDNAANAAVTTGGGPLLGVTQGDNATDASVNLGTDGPLGDAAQSGVDSAADAIGALFAGISVDTGGLGQGTIGESFGALTAQEQKLVIDRCVRILSNPASFNSDVVALCRKIASL